MRLSAPEEYGIRCLVRVARQTTDEPIRNSQIALSEGLTQEYVAKLMRILRKGGLVDSVRGANGGYVLARPADQISVQDAIDVLDGPFYSAEFCESFGGKAETCVHKSNCTLRVLWAHIGDALTQILSDVSIADLTACETSLQSQLSPVR